MRPIRFNYSDPLEIIWIHLAKQLGFEVVRDADVFAAYDGDAVLRIGTPETLDPDDSLGQMILHELCHALVEGPDAMRTPDWGLDFDNPLHRSHEFATLRLQAAFADQAKMRSFFASTTDFRWYFDLIPSDSLHTEISRQQISRVCEIGEFDLSTSDFNPITADDRIALQMARQAWGTAEEQAWRGPILDAINRTATLAKTIHKIAPDDSLWKSAD